MGKPMMIGLVAATVIAIGGYAAISQHGGLQQEPATSPVENTQTATSQQAASSAPVTGNEASAPTEGDAAPAIAPNAESNREAVLKVGANEIIIGEASAPHTLVEYASLSCTHCATFHSKVLPELKKNLIETGKAKLVFRHYPLNKPAMEGALLVNCAKQELRPKLLQVLFENQQKWAFSADSRHILKNMALLAGIGEDTFNRCQDDKAMQESILQGVQTATKVLEVDSTPSLFVDGKKFSEAMTPTTIAKAIGE